MPRSAGRDDARAIDEAIAALDLDQLRDLLASAAGRHDDVERELRLVAARAKGDLTELRTEVDRSLRTRRFLDYRASIAFAQAARPVVAELELMSRTAPSAELVELLQRAIGHVVKVLQHADDSSGAVGDVARDLLQTHAYTCDALVADPLKLARWMVRFRFVDQDFFEADPVRYRRALGETGIAAYRRAIDGAADQDAFAARYARERLAVLDGDLGEIVLLFGGDLHTPHQFARVAQAMHELGLGDEVLRWTARGIAETSGWQIAGLYDLACQTHEERGERLDVLRLRRSHHERMASLTTYTALREAALAMNTWDVECAAARAALQARDVGGMVDALLGDDEFGLAWQTAADAPSDAIGAARWLRLAERIEDERPADAVAVYLDVVAQTLETADRRAYREAVRILKRASQAARAAGTADAFANALTLLREEHRRRPTLIELLDKAKLP